MPDDEEDSTPTKPDAPRSKARMKALSSPGMDTLPDWLLELRVPLHGETAGGHIVRCVTAFIGVSLKENPDRLAVLFETNEKSPERAKLISEAKTNCATFMREIWCLAGCADHFVEDPYVTGQAVGWDLAAARDLGTLVDVHANPDAWKMLGPGWGLHYGTPGVNNDHMEFCLGVPDPKTGITDHAGGGRDDNEIGFGTSDVRLSRGRPLLHVIRPDLMATVGPAVEGLPQADNGNATGQASTDEGEPGA